jgi:hypothetical protein
VPKTLRGFVAGSAAIASIAAGQSGPATKPTAFTPGPPKQSRFLIAGRSGIRDPTALEPAVRLRNGWLAVARNEIAAVDVFSGSGLFVTRLPHKEDGIAAVPRVALAVIRGDTLVLLDRRSRRLAFYSSSRRSPMELVRISALDKRYTDMCALRDRIILFRETAGGVIDAFDLDSLRALHELVAVAPPRPKVEEPLNDSRLACDPSRRAFFVANSFSGRVRAYSSAGRLLWESEIANHVSALAKLDGGRSFGLVSPPGGYHVLARVLVAARSALIIQFSEHTDKLRPWGELGRILTVVLNTEDGREVGRTLAAPLIIATDQVGFLSFDSGGQLVSHPLDVQRKMPDAR